VPNDAEMGKTTRPSSTQDEPDRRSAQEPQEAGDVVWIAVANLTNDASTVADRNPPSSIPISPTVSPATMRETMVKAVVAKDPRN
jgi:hypothetical protein